MPLDLADLLRDHWDDYARLNAPKLTTAHHRAVTRVLACRTPELGGQLYRCGSCQKPHFAYHSCNHRSCPRCGSAEQAEWTARQEAKLLPVPYFLVTFTIPQELRALGLAFPKEFYSLMLKESAAALIDLARTKLKSPRARIAHTTVLHTWGRQIQHHPHIHAIVPATAWCPDRDEMLFPKDDHFFVHYRPLADRFRNRLRQALRQQHPEIYQNLTSAQLRALSTATPWNVQLQHAGTGKTAIRYLARYVRRSAVGPKRILGYDKNGKILVAWTQSGTNKTGVLHLHPHEFIRRWLLHVLPKGFARVRHYGFSSSSAKKVRLRVRLHLGCGGEPLVKLPERDPFACPCCGGELIFLRQLERLPRFIAPRGPPSGSREPKAFTRIVIQRP